jgi:hypothetical protein
MDALRPGEQFVCLVDFNGLGRKNADMKALLACFETLQKFYVERVMHLWFAQPPALFWCAAPASGQPCDRGLRVWSYHSFVCVCARACVQGAVARGQAVCGAEDARKDRLPGRRRGAHRHPEI